LLPAQKFHRRKRRGLQEEVTMLELFILAAGFAGGYAASVVSWPWIRAHAIGAATEIAQLRARAKALEDQIKGEL
jgi:cell division protein FtsB